MFIIQKNMCTKQIMYVNYEITKIMEYLTYKYCMKHYFETNL